MRLEGFNITIYKSYLNEKMFKKLYSFVYPLRIKRFLIFLIEFQRKLFGMEYFYNYYISY